MLRWAVLGTGFISHTVIEAINGSDGSEVALIAGRNRDRLDEFQRRHRIERSVVGYEHAVTDPGIDAVYIGLPNHHHHQPAVAAAAAGKAVLSEKSLTTTMETATALIDGVRSHGTFFVEGLMYLAHPLLQRLVELLTDGRLGTIRSITGSYGAAIGDVVNPEGRGTIYNLGCYPVSLLQLVIQTIADDAAFADRNIAAVGNRNRDGNIVDAALSVRFGNGILATIQSSDSYGNSSAFAVAGDNGILRFETNPWLPVAGDNVMTFEPFGRGQGDGTAGGADLLQTIVVSDPNDAFHHQIKMVERSVGSGLAEAERPSPRHADSLAVMALLTEWETACLDGHNGG